MSSRPHKVGLILDRNFGERVRDLARLFHVWIIESPVNNAAIQRARESLYPSTDSDRLASGITSFEVNDLDSAAQILANIGGLIDEHHGEHAHDPPWSEIAVYGAELTDELRDIFAELGASVCEATDAGFICRR